MNCFTRFCDSAEREKARLLVAERFRFSRILEMSSFSSSASGSGTFFFGSRPSLFYRSVSFGMKSAEE